MRRLRDYQRVQLCLGAREYDAYVVAVSGRHTTLVVARHQRRHAVSLDGQGTLTFLHAGRPVALQVLVRGDAAGVVQVIAHDMTCQADARRHPRVPIDLPVTITAVEGDAPPCFTRTIDLSEGGIRVRGVALTGPVEVFLRIPGGPRALRLRGEVLRSSGSDTVVAFSSPGATERVALRDIVLTIRCRLAGFAVA